MKRGSNLIARQYLKYGFCDGDVELSKTIMCVYFISDGTYIKIGISMNLRNRFSELQTSNANKLKALCVMPCKNRQQMQKYESILHKRFADKNIRGEWFLITPEDIKDFKSEYDIELYRVLE